MSQPPSKPPVNGVKTGSSDSAKKSVVPPSPEMKKSSPPKPKPGEKPRDRASLPALSLDLSKDEVFASTFTKFFKRCGFFVRTDHPFVLGDLVTVDVRVPGDSKVYKNEMLVVYIVPKNAEGGLAQGVGLAFQPASSELSDKILFYFQGKEKILKEFSTFPFSS